jgi:peptidoglycan LD-endopeptidase CwlK
VKNNFDDSELSQLSKQRLSTCHENLQKIVVNAAKRTKLAVLEGQRTREQQEQLFKKGATRTLNSKHLKEPSEAVDICPIPLNWKDTKSFHELKKIVFEEAEKLKIEIRWGGDWDRDGDTKDQKFNDLPHYELV